MSRKSDTPSQHDGKDQHILIIGAGLVGSLLAIFMARRGHRVELYDKNDDPRHTDISVRRSSINLSLSERAFVVLDRVGVGDTVRSYTTKTYGRMIHDIDGELTYQPYGNRDEATYSIIRNDLNNVLLDSAEQMHGVCCHFNERCVDIDLEAPSARFENIHTGLVHHEKAHRLFGADGVQSTVRHRFQRSRCFNFSQEYLDHGYKEVNIPSGVKDFWTDRMDAVHLWPRGAFMLLGLPNYDGSIVCSLHLSLVGDPSFESLDSEEALEGLFRDAFPDTLPVIPDLAGDFFRNSVNHFISVRCYPWCYQDRVALIGDAAHAIFPFYAQGTNAGFEDCLVLDTCLDEHDGDWRAAFEAYQRRRKPDADAISDMSREHYLEIRDLAGHPDFQLRKKIENRLAAIDAERFMPLYTLVTFTDIPYATARRRGVEHRELVDRLMTVDGIEQLADVELEALADQFLSTVASRRTSWPSSTSLTTSP